MLTLHPILCPPPPAPENFLDISLGTFSKENVSTQVNVECSGARFRGCGGSPNGD
jgi:hypothetical protein